MAEIYKEIPEFPGYSVSNCGNVVGKMGNVLKPRIVSEYLCVNLCGVDERKTMKIHRLVATAFIENPEGKPQVDHIDGNKLNNHLSNLRWATRSENLANTTVLKSKKSGLPKGVFTSGKRFLVRIRVRGPKLYIGTFETVELAAAAYEAAAREHFGEFAKV